jgi:alanine racemase
MGLLTINLNALKQNYDILKTLTDGDSEVGAVVKANGYGLDSLKIAQALYQKGCRSFFIAKAHEVEPLQSLPDDVRIIVLNGYDPAAAALYARHGMIPVLGSLYELEAYKAQNGLTDKPCFIKLCTQMNRAGMDREEWEAILTDTSLLDGLRLQGLIAHFACADELGHTLNEEQFALFSDVTKSFDEQYEGLTHSMANSSAMFRNKDYHFDLTRPGMALYGLNPTPEQNNPMQRVVDVKLQVIRTRLIPKGEITGYGATYRFEKDSPVALLSAGYADGIHRCLGNTGKLYWNGIACPIRGRVSMDMIVVDLSDVPENTRPEPGAMMELIGPHQSADDLAEDAGTIGYEILTSLGNRYERVYTD